jgi:hypothetical protein
MTREVCGSIRIERGEALSIAPHDVPLVPAGRKRLSPFSKRFPILARDRYLNGIVRCVGERKAR